MGRVAFSLCSNLLNFSNHLFLRDLIICNWVKKDLDGLMNYTFKHIMNIININRKTIAKANILALLTAIIVIPIPMIIPYVVDQFFLKKPENNYILLIIIGFFLLSSILRFISFTTNKIQFGILSKLSKKIIYEIRLDLFKHIKKVNISDLHKINAESLNSRFLIDLDSLGNFIGITLSRALVSVITLLLIFAIILSINWQLSIFIILFYPVLIWYSTKDNYKFVDLKKDELEAIDELNKKTIFIFQKYKNLKMVQKDYVYDESIIASMQNLKNKSNQYNVHSYNTILRGTLLFNISIDLFQFSTLIFAFLLGMNLKEILIVFSYIWFMLNPVLDILNIQHSYYSARSATARIDEIYSLQRQEAKNIVPNFTKFDRIQVKNLSFAFEEKVIYDGLSIDIFKKEVVLIKGESGIGKSTFIDILNGFIKVEPNTVFFNSIPIEHLDETHFRENIVNVPQFPVIIPDTLRKNLEQQYDINDQKMIEMLILCELKTWYDSLENGLDTKLDNLKLSGGQIQRIAIANALLSTASIVIFDEATSALDINTEEKIIKNISHLLTSKTLIIVSHKGAISKYVDSTYVMEQYKLMKTVC